MLELGYLVFASLVFASSASADGGAAEIGAGGIVFKKLPEITIDSGRDFENFEETAEARYAD